LHEKYLCFQFFWGFIYYQGLFFDFQTLSVLF
jgi:hypothetical protein